VQWKFQVPEVLNVRVDEPEAMLPMSVIAGSLGASNTTLWVTPEVFEKVTWVPFVTLSSAGSNVAPRMQIVAAAQVPPPPGGGGGGGGGDTIPPPLPPLHESAIGTIANESINPRTPSFRISISPGSRLRRLNGARSPARSGRVRRYTRSYRAYPRDGMPFAAHLMPFTAESSLGRDPKLSRSQNHSFLTSHPWKTQSPPPLGL
jgi:hypothetical protein